MEKKEYEAPKMLVVELDVEAPLLAGSDGGSADDDGPDGIITNDGYFD